MRLFISCPSSVQVYAYNKPPRWNDAVGAFVLNFNGRVTMASVKNFQLISHDDQERIIVQFGRVAKDEFTMDFQWSVSPFQVGISFSMFLAHHTLVTSHSHVL